MTNNKINEKELVKMFKEIIPDFKEYHEGRKSFLKEAGEHMIKTNPKIMTLSLNFYIKAVGNYFDYVYWKSKNNPIYKKYKRKYYFYQILSALNEFIPIYLFASIGVFIITMVNTEYWLYSRVWSISVFVGYLIYHFKIKKETDKKEYQEVRDLCEKPVGRWGKIGN